MPGTGGSPGGGGAGGLGGSVTTTAGAGGTGIAGGGGVGGSGGTGDDCFEWSGGSSPSLQDAVALHDCVEVQAGSYVIDAPVPVPPGHTLRGVSAAEAILTANQGTWTFGCCDAMVTDTLPSNPAANPFHVESLTLDGAGVATYNLCCRGYVADDLVMSNSRCSAIGIAGAGATVRNSTMLNSAQHTNVPNVGVISCATGNFGGVDEGAAIYSQGTASDYGSLIEGNTIDNSYGPAMDVNGAWGGTFRNNVVTNNSAWAAVSLYGASQWLIENNQISHPAGEPPQPYHPYCATGPAGGHSAGIFLCQDTDTDNLVTNHNTIRGNSTSSYYGILSVGADEVHPYWAPRNNTFENNDVFGSTFGCADDFAPGQWGSDQNVWTGNNCAGSPNTGPTTF
ncbi:MAG: right-handed parallel beta-helix repeat-containing protein [Deltaproteobacteria bacterium]|nr:right-handed parallel beta-helix repeat-containing protein [Deltaproteobacteria bacterium]